MPNRTIYIRVNDTELWDRLPDKSERVHQMLHSRQTPQPKPLDAERDVVQPTSRQNPTNGFGPKKPHSPGDITDAMRATANGKPLPPANKNGSSLDPVPLYAIVIEANGVIIAKDLTRDVADEKLAELNVDGDMAVVQQ